MKNWLKIVRFDIAACLLGVMLTFAFAPYEFFPLAFIAPALLLVLWWQQTAKRSFWLGLWFGIGLFGAGTYWVFISVHTIGGVPTWLALVITSGFIALMSCFPAIVGFCFNRYFPVNGSAKMICAFPALWVFAEWIRSFFLTGFPWLFLGYSQTNSPLKGFAPILSVYGVSLAVLLTSALFVHASFKLKEKSFRQACLSLCYLALIWIGGSVLNFIPWTKASGDPISVSLVQGNIPQKIKWSPDHLQLSLDRYESLTEPLWGKSQLIIWPEGAIPLPQHEAEGFLADMEEKAIASGSQLILGIPIKVRDQDKYFNAIISLGSDQQVYAKRHLVPFGEYVPLTQWFALILNFMNIPTSDLIPGNLKQSPFIINGKKIIPAICYEIAFPELINTRDEDIGFILVLTNDAWFGESAAQAQHVQMAAMRAIELRRPVIVVSNDGITAMIGPNGVIQAKAPQRDPFVLEGMIQSTVGLTPWMVAGMDPILVIAITLLAIAGFANMKALKRKTGKLIIDDKKPIPHTIQQEHSH